MSARVVVVTGTGTGVGKTVVTAALASTLATSGSVTVVKPVQTGIGPGAGEESDAQVVARLAGCPVHELAVLRDPLAPDTAARLRGVSIPRVAEHAARIRRIAEGCDAVVVEGAGGLLVRLDTEGGTVLDLAARLGEGVVVEVVVVVSPGLGTLNHTELTVQALRHGGIEPAALVIGSWPDGPGLAERCNREDLPVHTGVPLRGVVPEGAGGLDARTFRRLAPTWLETWLDSTRGGGTRGGGTRGGPGAKTERRSG